MKISIREKLKPFSHTPGASCLLPGTHLVVEAFPTLIRIGEKEFRLSITGPVRGFTLEQDLEKNRVRVFGEAKEGFYRLQIMAYPSTIEVTILNAPSSGLFINEKLYQRKEKIVSQESFDFSLPPIWERLSLGVQKKQDWDLVLRRFDLKEILPVLFGLSQKVPSQSQALRSGFVEQNGLEAFCRTSFSGILVPCLDDTLFQGIQNPWKITAPSQAFQAIRSLFFQQQDMNLSFLPANFFPAGRMTQLQVPNVGEIDLEWGSWKLRRVGLRAFFSGRVQCDLPSNFTSFRVCTLLSPKGRRHFKDDPFIIESGTTYFLDRFQK